MGPYRQVQVPAVSCRDKPVREPDIHRRNAATQEQAPVQGVSLSITGDYRRRIQCRKANS
jgi:hypothetical protein